MKIIKLKGNKNTLLDYLMFWLDCRFAHPRVFLSEDLYLFFELDKNHVGPYRFVRDPSLHNFSLQYFGQADVSRYVPNSSTDKKIGDPQGRSHIKSILDVL